MEDEEELWKTELRTEKEELQRKMISLVLN
jgi:hypothetical protein